MWLELMGRNRRSNQPCPSDRRHLGFNGSEVDVSRIKAPLMLCAARFLPPSDQMALTSDLSTREGPRLGHDDLPFGIIWRERRYAHALRHRMSGLAVLVFREPDSEIDCRSISDVAQRERSVDALRRT